MSIFQKGTTREEIKNHTKPTDNFFTRFMDWLDQKIDQLTGEYWLDEPESDDDLVIVEEIIQEEPELSNAGDSSYTHQ